MKRIARSTLFLLGTLSIAGLGAGITASAQGVDTAAERARIANERIQRDMRRRQEQDEETPGDGTGSTGAAIPSGPSSGLPYAAAERPPALPAYAPSTSLASPSTAAQGQPALENDYTRTLTQLRVLGELRDAGYLTDDEFSRIKTRIISSVF